MQEPSIMLHAENTKNTKPTYGQPITMSKKSIKVLIPPNAKPTRLIRLVSNK